MCDDCTDIINMNTFQIRNMLMHDSNVPLFGVFPSDHVSKTRIKWKRAAIVFNTDPSFKPGKHWVAAFVQYPYGHYFDSYGLPPSPIFRTFMDRNCKSWKYNTLGLQKFGSDECGHYCVYFIHPLSRGKRAVFPKKGD